ncbi:hypothetical protein BC777_1089 [Yoonia maricola]|uniref:Transferrin-binding protein B C-lobe/N-lobe beta barrel domain-containing protein n=1 Tax=Yoonia maricola TaxID=420999 RepID=A0A2M8WMV1_9RHOB|nr:hypothetical protein [Yoonia maricola]PJI92244.1 hypothetical protein BC777_1089 [Yoonia maricola]
MYRFTMTLVFLFWLAACGGGGGGSDRGGIDPRLARLNIYEAQKLRVLGDPGAGVMGMPRTADENLPMGTMDFSGSGTMRVENGVTPIVIFGDATLRVDFGSGDAAGAIENAFGTNSADDLVDYGGTITLQGTAAGQDMPLDYAGTLSEGDQTFGFDGTLTAVFLGNPTTALSGADLEAEIDHNGVMRSGTLVITLEETDAP